MVNKFTQKAQNALSSAQSFASELGHSYIGTEHLLFSLALGKDSIASKILARRGVTESKLRGAIIDYMGIGSKKSLSSDDITPRLHQVIEGASLEAERSGVRFIGTEHLLISLLNTRDCVAIKLLTSEGISCSEIKSDLCAYLGSAPSRKELPSREDEYKKAKKSSLLSYGKDLCALASEGKTDPVLCRDKETERIIRVLCRRSKNNPCLIGEPGVGKTAVIEGLAQRMVIGDVPAELRGKRIIALDISAMIAGAKYRGEFEDRIKQIVDEVTKSPDVILFVDEMHVIVGAGAAEGAIDAANILKPALARGEFRMIGATTPGEYHAKIEKDPALERRFQQIKICEPSREECRDILYGLRDRYETHHGIKISDGAIDAAIRLSVRYMHDRFLPDKAIDLIDEAASSLRLTHKKELSSPALLWQRKEEAVRAGDFALAASIKTDVPASTAVSLLDPSEEQQDALVLCDEDIARIVSEHTGIPCRSIVKDESERLTALEEQLSRQVIGQSEAVNAVANAVRRGRVGLGREGGPICSFLFVGSTGVGKTALAKALSSALFESEDALIQLDMSEYMERHSVSKLIGAPPGYVGFGEEGMLTRAVRRNPYSVVLFDEIEKAHSDIFNLLLQILEEGKLTDAEGREIDFSSTIVIMTSNILSSSDKGTSTLGFCDSTTEQDLRYHKKLKEFFRDEFLGRMDEIILFSRLGQSELEKIAHNMQNELCRRANEASIELEIDESVSLLIAEECTKNHAAFGARPVARELRRLVETPLSAHILKAPSESSQKRIRVYVKDNEIVFENVI